jgi:hypothetical protein
VLLLGAVGFDPELSSFLDKRLVGGKVFPALRIEFPGKFGFLFFEGGFRDSGKEIQEFLLYRFARKRFVFFLYEEFCGFMPVRVDSRFLGAAGLQYALENGKRRDFPAIF